MLLNPENCGAGTGALAVFVVLQYRRHGREGSRTRADLFLLNINQIQWSRNFALVSARYDRNTVEYIVTGNAIRRRRESCVSAFVEILARKRADLNSRICSNLIVIVLICQPSSYSAILSCHTLSKNTLFTTVWHFVCNNVFCFSGCCPGCASGGRKKCEPTLRRNSSRSRQSIHGILVSVWIGHPHLQVGLA